MKLRATVHRDYVYDRWLLTLWRVVDDVPHLFGQKPFEDWQEALNWGLWRVGLKPTRG